MNISLFLLASTGFILSTFKSQAQDSVVVSPDKQLTLSVNVVDGRPTYSVKYMNKTMLENSPLGLETNEADFTSRIKYISKSEDVVTKNYDQDKIKKSRI